MPKLAGADRDRVSGAKSKRGPASEARLPSVRMRAHSQTPSRPPATMHGSADSR